jgi:hypothetical protein
MKQRPNPQSGEIFTRKAKPSFYAPNPVMESPFLPALPAVVSQIGVALASLPCYVATLSRRQLKLKLRQYRWAWCS